MGARVVATLAVLGGVALAISSAPYISTVLAHPDLRAWDLSAKQSVGWPTIGEAGLVVLGVSVGGVAIVLIDRIPWAVTTAALLAATGPVLGLVGAYPGWILLPAGSGVVAVYLARIRAVPTWIASVHAVSALGFFWLLTRYLTNAPVGVTAIVVPVYALSWSVIGLELLRWLRTEPHPALH